jgi:hypothetical protein
MEVIEALISVFNISFDNCKLLIRSNIKLSGRNNNLRSEYAMVVVGTLNSYFGIESKLEHAGADKEPFLEGDRWFWQTEQGNN